MGSDLTDQQCVLNFRHTDCTDFGHWTEKSMCAVSSVLYHGTSLNNLYHAAKKRGRGAAGARGGGVWLGTGGQLWTSKGNIYVLCTGARVMGVSMVIAAWGEGVIYAIFPPPPRRIACLSPETRVRTARLDF
jgi:hypothetical protein